MLELLYLAMFVGIQAPIYLPPTSTATPLNGHTSPGIGQHHHHPHHHQRGVTSPPVTSLGVPAAYPVPPTSSFLTTTSHALPHHQRALGGYPFPPHPLIYWPYPSPPISPNAFYNYPGLVPLGPPPPLPHNGAISPSLGTPSLGTPSLATPNGSVASMASSPVPSVPTIVRKIIYIFKTLDINTYFYS